MPPGRIWTPDPVEHDHPLNQGVLSWWLGLEELSGGNTFYDLLVKNPGTLTNGPTWGSDLNGFGAVEFDGSSKWVLLTSSNLPTFPFSVSLWFRLGASPPAFNIPWWTGVVGTTTWNAHYLAVTSGGSVSANSVVSNSFASATHPTAISVGQWAHVVGVWESAASRKIYLNGVYGAADTGSRNPTLQQELLGRDGLSSGTNFCKGVESDIRRYSRVLTDDDVAGLYDQGLRGNPDTLRRVRGSWFVLGSAAGLAERFATFAQTLDADTLSAAVANATTAALSQTQAADSAAASAAVASAAALARTLDADTGAAAAAIAVAAALSRTLDDDSLAASAANAIAAALAQTLGDDALDASVSAGINALLATLDDDTLAATASAAVAASLDATQAGESGSASATVVVTGELLAAQAGDTLSGVFASSTRPVRVFRVTGRAAATFTVDGRAAASFGVPGRASASFAVEGVAG